MFRNAVVFCSVALGVIGCAAPKSGPRQVKGPSGELFWAYEASEGLPDGESRTYHDNGKLRSVGTFLNAQLHGMFERYREDGEFDFKGYFWHDVLVWRSRDEFEEPPQTLLAELAPLHDPC